MCTLNAPEEVELAELLCELHPWADMVRYAKAGGEGMAMAVRIARAYTGKDIVLVCGYHGWHDWYLAANLEGGDPLAGVHLQGLEPCGVPKNLAGSNLIFHYNDFAAFKALVDAHKGHVAAVIMEPIRNNYPEGGFLKKIRQVTEEQDILLVFDEISSGFRLCCGGSHLVLGVTPDMAIFAKAMTNGYPLAAVIGKKEVMQAAQDTFISSTFWTERIGLAAAVAAVRYYQKHEVHKHQIHIGETVQTGWKALAEKNSLEIEVGGIMPMSHFGFAQKDTLACKTYFTQEMLKKGWLAGTAFYTSLAHTDAIVEQYLTACDEVFCLIAQAEKSGTDIKTLLDGPVCHGGFARLN
jgi:glutamate-1-semialdehyde aminotransferase